MTIDRGTMLCIGDAFWNGDKPDRSTYEVALFIYLHIAFCKVEGITAITFC